MANAIFSKDKCLYGALYQTICGFFTKSGWVDVSSKPNGPAFADDWQIFYSSSKTDARHLYVRLAPFQATTNVFQPTGIRLQYQLLENYIPSTTENTNGTRVAPISPNMVTPTYPVEGTIPLDVEVTYHWYGDKNRVIFVLEYPPPYTTTANFYYFGIPDEDDLFAAFNTHNGLFFASSTYINNTQNVVHVTNTSDDLPSAAAAYNLNTYNIISYYDPSMGNVRQLYPIQYGQPNLQNSAHCVGIVSDVWSIQTNGVVSGRLFSTLAETDETYKTFVAGGWTGKIYTCNPHYFAIRVNEVPEEGG